MIITTTDTIQGHNIVRYLGLVSCPAREMRAIGSRETYIKCGWDGPGRSMIDEVSKWLSDEAANLGANAVVGVSFIHQQHDCCVIGTAVVIE